MKKIIFALMILAAVSAACSKPGEEPLPVPPPHGDVDPEDPDDPDNPDNPDEPDEPVVIEPLEGLFSVSASDKVQFSPGNLYVIDGTDYRMEEQQYGFDRTSSAEHQSLFAYSADYGSLYCKSNGLEDGKWRQLSLQEWRYLLQKRGSGSFLCTAGAPVSIEGTSVEGLFLYPDSYSGKGVDGSFTWAKIESEGIVFLPAAGFMIGGVRYGQGRYGYYWTADRMDDNMAYDVKFSANGVVPYNIFGTFAGYAVRLVHDVKNSIVP